MAQNWTGCNNLLLSVTWKLVEILHRQFSASHQSGSEMAIGNWAVIIVSFYTKDKAISFWTVLYYSNKLKNIWTASSEFGTYRLCEQRRFRRATASAHSRQNLRCSLIQAVSQEEPSDRKPDPWPLWMAGRAQLKFVMTECSKTQIRLTGLIFHSLRIHIIWKNNSRTPN